MRTAMFRSHRRLHHIPAAIIVMWGAAASADQPTWWGKGNPPVIVDGIPANNYGPANIGQAKYMVKCALDALRPILPGVTGAIEADLEDIVDLEVPVIKTPEWLEKQKAPLLIGELKALSHPFYEHLDDVDSSWLALERINNSTNHPGTIFPWTLETTDDKNKSMANVGQLKNVFKLRFDSTLGPSYDTDLDGLPDVWELLHFGSLSQSAHDDLDGDGSSNIREYYLGSNPNDPGSTPVGLISANSQNNVAITAGGRIFTWGVNDYGQLGRGYGGAQNALSPQQISKPAGMGTVVQVALGSNTGGLVDDAGNLWMWGSSRIYVNQTLVTIIPNSQSAIEYSPVKVELPVPVARVAIGTSHVLALDRLGRMWSWGRNDFGQLGNGNTQHISQPALVSNAGDLGEITSIAANSFNSYLIDADGAGWAWGSNYSGSLGIGNTVPQNTPTRILTTGGLTSIKELVVGNNFVIAKKDNNTLWSWGNNYYFQTGHGILTTDRITPGQISLPLPFTPGLRISSGSAHSLATDSNGSVWGWGRNSSRQLGINISSERSTPIKTSSVADWENIVDLACGGSHSLAIKNDGSLWVWGSGAPALGLRGIGVAAVPTLLADLLLSADDHDADNDGIPNALEIRYGTDPNNSDSNGDGLMDGMSVQLGLDPMSLDTDGDGISNAQELLNGTSPILADTDGDGVDDAEDAFPLDPSRWAAPASTPGDTSAPQITLITPENASPQ